MKVFLFNFRILNQFCILISTSRQEMPIFIRFGNGNVISMPNTTYLLLIYIFYFPTDKCLSGEGIIPFSRMLIDLSFLSESTSLTKYIQKSKKNSLENDILLKKFHKNTFDTRIMDVSIVLGL